jgi:hypothetical protein
MGRSFISIRLAINSMAERWTRAARTLGGPDREYGRRIARLAKTHGSEAFFGCDYPLEGAVFSVMVELGKQLEADATGRGGEPFQEKDPREFSRT